MNSITEKKIIFYFASFVAILIPAILFFSNLFAEWWLIDDHELFSFLGSIHNYYGIWDYFNLLIEKTEVGRFGETARFRPSYFFLRLVELYFFGLNATLFYLVRYIIAILFSLVLFLFLRKFLDSIISISLVLVVWSYPFWADVFSRMGPAEIYGTLGLTLILLSYVISSSNKILTSFLRLIGLLILIGAKENFLVFIAISFIEIWKLIRNRENPIVLYWFEFLPILYAFFIFLSLFGFYTNYSEDIYGNSTNISDRLDLFVVLLKDSSFIIFLLSVLLICIFSVFSRKFFIKNKEYILIVFFCFTTYLLNFLFYHSKWPTGMRYDFPGLLCFPIALAFTIKIFLKYYYVSSKKQVLVLILVSLFCFNISGIKANFKSSIENQKRTVAFSNFLKETRSNLIVNPNVDVAIRIGSAWDYEPYFSLLVFFTYYDLKNQIFLKLDSIPKTTDFEKQLLNVLSKRENLKAQPRKGCVVFTFSKLEDRTICSSQNNFLVPW
ncbi:hypothetical protein [Leptospira meyeri]|uniref:hypothetical protein n=1 Tax=Leptospira meyeri TaxID=29508 RepID=UPI000C29E401|nr:hypothetical protein [Leptospira meyeri]PJZ80021.1 hypothetical protein CH359_14180 [Leptospira meyeri]PJZ98522.1 hypothetical protein CH358_06295 [Leptospira meyeri]PKA14101.1 hypothetical protein CH372_00170 [Leptospira meyeri]PKA27072.1 hypothetical protein CH381_07525 [Leptospira sp. mixed culture ATI2-C-A1]